MAPRTIIVGAGSSGAVIAARLTERSDTEVVLLEAGPDYPDPESLPRDLADGTRNSMTRHDWGYRYRPMPGQVLFACPRGKVVGGSSAVNTCIALRGQPYDYDEWASMGLPEWSFAGCLPFFKRLENDLDIRNEWHSQEGPVPIRRHRPDELAPWQAAFLEACREERHPACADGNDPTTTGYGPHAMNKVDGVRMSAARCYLTAAVRRREALTIRAGTLVRRVLFANRRVTGVEVESAGTVAFVPASRVVLCAGAVATPGILMRSGIGPRRAVEAIGVSVVSDVPAVGARLLDHPGVAVILAPKKGVTDLLQPFIQTFLRYTSEGSACPNDMQIQPGSFMPFPLVTFPLVTLMCCIGKPRGHGRMEIRSASPHARPRMDANMLLDARDRACALGAVERIAALARSRAMRKLATFLWPSARVLESGASMEAWMPKSCGSGYHPCGTVPMGPEGSPDAALDGRGRVRGVQGLFVADASIFPTIPSANTNLTTLMVGERFGSWLREDMD